MKPQQLKEACQSFWSERDGRERRLLGIGGAAVTLTLLYLVAIGPALVGGARLHRDLPQLRQQALALQALSREARALAANAPAAAILSTQESIEAALGRRSLKAQSVSVSGDLVRIQLNNVPFSSLIEWLDETQKTTRLSVIDSTFTAQAQTDIVNATLNLRQPKTDDKP